jgi:hypothetical protein
VIRVRNALLAPPLSARTVTRESPASSNCASAVPGTIMWSAVLLAVALPGSSSPEAASPPAPVEPWSTNQRSVWDPNGRPNAEAALYFSERGRDHSRIRPRSPGPADGSGTGAPRRFPRAGCCWMLAVRATYPAVANRFTVRGTVGSDATGPNTRGCPERCDAGQAYPGRRQRLRQHGHTLPGPYRRLRPPRSQRPRQTPWVGPVAPAVGTRRRPIRRRGQQPGSGDHSPRRRTRDKVRPVDPDPPCRLSLRLRGTWPRSEHLDC